MLTLSKSYKTWDILENKHLFNAKNPNGERSSIYHIAEMVALLGLPPPDYLERSKTSWKYFDNVTGKWKGVVKIPDVTLERSEEQLEGKDKIEFLDFIRKMLRWIPEERQTAKQLLRHPWLLS